MAFRFIQSWVIVSIGFLLPGICQAQLTEVPLGPDQIVNTSPATANWYPEITTLTNGDYVVVWWHHSGSTIQDNDGIRARIFAPDGTPNGPDFQINTVELNGQELPAVSALENGGFVVVWDDDSQRQPDASGGRVVFKVFDDDGVAISQEILVANVYADSSFRKGITGLQNGNFVVSWTDPTGPSGTTPSKLYAQIYGPTGNTVGGTITISDPGFVENAEAAITTLSSGDFAVSWTSTEFTNIQQRDIFARVYQEDGTPITPQFMVNTVVTADNQEEAKIAALEDGGFVVVFIDIAPATDPITSYDYQMRVRRYDASYAPLGPDFVVNTTEADPTSYDPDIVGLKTGGYVVTWWDDNLNGSDTDQNVVRARIMDNCGHSSSMDFQVNSKENGPQMNSVVTPLDNGGFTIAFTDRTGPPTNPGPISIRQRLYGPAVLTSNGESPCKFSALKVCKAAGEGVELGESFEFTIENFDGTPPTTHYTPAGAMPGGSCTLIGSTFKEGDQFKITETLPSGYKIADIIVAPSDRADSIDIPNGGYASLTLGEGVTEVTFINEKATGYLEICKRGSGMGFQDFDLKYSSGSNTSVSVPIGYCAPAMEVPAGGVKITETITSLTPTLSNCATFPDDRLVNCDLPNRTMVVQVAKGDVSSQTVAIFTNN